jgi:hypothetical protein
LQSAAALLHCGKFQNQIRYCNGAWLRCAVIPSANRFAMANDYS